MRTALAQKYPDSESTDMAQNESTELATQVAELRADVRLDRTVQEIKDSMAEIRLDIKESLASAKLWAIGLYIALAGTLLYVIARSAKWF